MNLIELVVDALRWSVAVGRAAAVNKSLHRAVHLTSDGPVPGLPLVHTVDSETRWSQRVLRCHGACDLGERCTRHKDEVDEEAVLSMLRQVETSAVPGTICVDATNSERVSFHYLLRSVVGVTALDVTCYTTESAGLLAGTVAQLFALRSLRVLLGPALPDLTLSDQLTTLRLETCVQTGGPPPTIGPGIVALAPQLRVLSLRGTCVGPDALKLMCAARNLLALDISDTRMSSDDVALVLGKMPRLRRLDMRGLPRDECVRRAVQALPRLDHVACDGGFVQLAVPLRRLNAEMRAALRESVAPRPPPPLSVAPPPAWPVLLEQSSPRAVPVRPTDRPVAIPVQPIVPESDGPRMTHSQLRLAIERARPPPAGQPVDTVLDTGLDFQRCDGLEPPSSILQRIKARPAAICRKNGPPAADLTTEPADGVVATQPLVDRHEASRSAADRRSARGRLGTGRP